MKRKMILLALARLGGRGTDEDSVVSIVFNASDPNPMLLPLSISLLLRGES